MDKFRDWDTVVYNANKPSAPPTNLSEEQHKTNALNNATDPAKQELMPREIVKQLTALRTTRKKSQKTVANELNLPAKIIQEIESFRHVKDMKLAQRIAKSLGGTLNKH